MTSLQNRNPQQQQANQVLNSLLQYRASQNASAPAAPAGEGMPPQDAQVSQSTSGTRQVVADASGGGGAPAPDRPWDRVRGLLGGQNGYGGGMGGSSGRRPYLAPGDQSTQTPLPRG